jgi:hypothetical protein
MCNQNAIDGTPEHQHGNKSTHADREKVRRSSTGKNMQVRLTAKDKAITSGQKQNMFELKVLESCNRQSNPPTLA